MSSGPTPALAKAALAASVLTLEGRPWPWIAGLKTSNEPKLRVRVATESSLTDLALSRRAISSEATTMAAPPSPGEQNMYCVSGSLTIAEDAIVCSDMGSRRQALGLREPLRKALAATLARVAS